MSLQRRDLVRVARPLCCPSPITVSGAAVLVGEAVRVRRVDSLPLTPIALLGPFQAPPGWLTQGSLGVDASPPCALFSVRSLATPRTLGFSGPSW